MDEQRVNDLQSQIDRIHKKVHKLKLSRTNAIQPPDRRETPPGDGSEAASMIVDTTEVGPGVIGRAAEARD